MTDAEKIDLTCHECGGRFTVIRGSGAWKDGLCNLCWPRVTHPTWPWPRAGKFGGVL